MFYPMVILHDEDGDEVAIRVDLFRTIQINWPDPESGPDPALTEIEVEIDPHDLDQTATWWVRELPSEIENARIVAWLMVAALERERPDGI
jgi:hypothetical protein